MDPLDRIDEIIALVEGARSVPMSRNCMLDRGEMIGAARPAARRAAGRDAPGRRPCSTSATRSSTPASARPTGSSPRREAEHARLVSLNEIIVSAEHEGTRLISDARAEAQRLRDEVDDYVDTTLANFEQFLTRSLASIERGRDKMHALREIGSFVGDADERPLPF